MRKLTMLLSATALIVAATLVVAAGPTAGRAADHLDAPDLTSPAGNLMADAADLFVFPPAGRPNLVVIGATYNPAAGVFGPEGFDPSVTYSIKVSNDGDTEADHVFELTFDAARPNGRQDYTLTMNGDEVAAGRTGTPSRFAQGTGRVFAGVVDDPFFFDLDAFLGSGGRGFCDGGEADFFAGLNVNAVVIRMPVADLGDGAIGVWATNDGDDGQIDRVGFPAINTVFIPSNKKNAYNAASPSEDEDRFFRFLRDGFKNGGNDSKTARALADALLPDILPYDPSATAGFLNGRQPADDVIDVELALLTAGALAGDCVPANDVEFRDVFPYLAAAH